MLAILYNKYTLRFIPKRDQAVRVTPKKPAENLSSRFLESNWDSKRWKHFFLVRCKAPTAPPTPPKKIDNTYDVKGEQRATSFCNDHNFLEETQV